MPVSCHDENDGGIDHLDDWGSGDYLCFSATGESSSVTVYGG